MLTGRYFDGRIQYKLESMAESMFYIKHTYFIQKIAKTYIYY